MIFALSFCPVSAALFFGSLIPLSLKAGSPVVLPVLYGIGTGLPVSIFAVALALGARSLSKALNRLGQIEKWSRYATGTVFIVVGIYYVCDHILDII
jgi:cytochrome c-type biogenesis protein